MEKSLHPATQDGKTLLKEYPPQLIPFYEDRLSRWSDISREFADMVLNRGEGSDKEKSLEHIGHWKPFIFKFLDSFSKSIYLKYYSNFEIHAMDLNPEVFCVDFYFRFKRGEDVTQILKDHCCAVFYKDIFFGIMMSFHKAIDGEFYGKELSKMVLNVSGKYVDLDTKTKPGLRIAIAELLDKSRQDAENLSGLPGIKNYIEKAIFDCYRDKGREITNTDLSEQIGKSRKTTIKYRKLLEEKISAYSNKK